MGIFLLKFYEKFPEFKGRKFYITGESYAGHYIPYIAEYLLSNPNFKQQGIILEGVAIGNGWTRPELQYKQNANFAYQEKLLNRTEHFLLNWGFELCGILIHFDLPYQDYVCDYMQEKILLDKNGNQRFNTYDVRIPCEKPPLCYDMDKFDVYLNREDVQRELNVPGRKW